MKVLDSKLQVVLQGAGSHDPLLCLLHAFVSVSVDSCGFLPPRPRWVVPVLPKGELEVLLEAAIDLSKKGKSVLNEYSCSMDD